MEDPNNPLFGPTLWGLKLVGLWRINNTKLSNFLYNSVFVLETIFVISEMTHLYFARNDLSDISESLCIACPTFICLIKCLTCVYWEADWRELIEGVAQEELLVLAGASPAASPGASPAASSTARPSASPTASPSASPSESPTASAFMAHYIAYSRMIGTGYCVITSITLFALMVVPFLTLFITPGLIMETLNGTKPYPQIIKCLWYPFDHTKMPGYVVAILFQFTALLYNCAVTSVFEAHVVSFMAFFKGHLMIITEKCRMIFEGTEEELTKEIVTQRIKEIHRHYSHLQKMKNLYNSLVSPVMFLYVLLSSITLCGSVIQFSLVAEQASEKASTLQFIFAVISQLLLYCWHCNDVTVQSEGVAGGVFASDWWRADVSTRRNLLLLAGQLTHTYTFSAGPFTLLTMSTFITIIKASYSFYTFLTQMKN